VEQDLNGSLLLGHGGLDSLDIADKEEMELERLLGSNLDSDILRGDLEQVRGRGGGAGIKHRAEFH
jgi:hypothetical protein